MRFFHNQLEYLTGIEVCDIVARSRVPRLSGGTSFHLKNAEIAKFDSSIFHQRVYDGVEGLLDDFLRFQLREPDFLGNRSDNLFLGHDSNLP